MNAWPLSAATPSPAAGGLLAGAARLVGHVGTAGFAQAALGALHEAQLRPASWSVYQRWPDRAPVLHASASLGIADTTRDCFHAYRDGLYHHDRSFDGVRAGQAMLLRMHADDAPTPQHRERIYRRHGMLERLSVVQQGHDASLLAINLYHHDHQGRFSDGEVAGLAALAPVLLAAVQRHIALAGAADDGPCPGAAAATGVLAQDPVRAQLLQRCPQLTPRELDVCERVLRGWSYDGIAADMGLSLATVKTYRARAFARLGLHFRSQLFALLQARH